ncbi:MAG: UDP-N-acetylmuramoyl-tripeptide--D-alanyl-D-alanine ligase [Thermodesulfobacteriota bacterium]
MRLTVKEIINATGGKFGGGDKEKEFTGISIDSRTIKTGDVFFALKGPNYDGHSFLQEVIKKGSSGAVVHRTGGKLPPPPPPGFSLISVDDTLRAIGDLAAYVRNSCGVSLLAIGGTSGKTTTKDMASLILKKRNVLKTEGNMNNLVGLPLTLLGLTDENETAVVELGISEEGEMSRLTEICSPDVALLTNIGRGHLETLGSIEMVASEKGKIYNGLGPDGVRVVNLDDPWVVRVAEEAYKKGVSGERVTYSVKGSADVSLKEVRSSDVFITDVVFDVRGTGVPVTFKAPGGVNIQNAAAAIAASLPFGVDYDEITDGLAGFTAAPGRMEVMSAVGVTLLDDTYNANPESVKAAVDTLCLASGRKIAVLGEMLELGDDAEDMHAEVGRYMAGKGASVLIAVGSFADFAVDGAIGAGMDQDLVFAYKDKKDAAIKLIELVGRGDTVLVKGSRSTAMEEVATELKKFLSVG